MGVIKNGIMTVGNKKLRVQVYGYERDGEFVETDVWVNKIDLENVGAFDALQEKAE